MTETKGKDSNDNSNSNNTYLDTEVIAHDDLREGIVIEFPMEDHHRIVLTEYYQEKNGEFFSKTIGEEHLFLLGWQDMKDLVKTMINSFKDDPEAHIFIDEDVRDFIESAGYDVEERVISLEEKLEEEELQLYLAEEAT